MLSVEVGEGMLSVELAKFTDDWMWHVDRIYYNMIEVGLG
jgi:hypothetical protein